MSLFQIRDTWSYKPQGDEECGIGCLSVANVNNAEDGKNKIICGGYGGLLHIYSPSEAVENSASGSHVDDVLLETQLSYPILQVGCGNFLSSTAGIHLAVLHPRLLVVYKVFLTNGSVVHGKQCKIEMVYQHKLERTAANMTWGPFGTKESHDFICVQSMDGALTLYEHETFMFARFIPNFMLPSPLIYNQFNDSFVTVSSSNFLESYSYQSLAVASESQTDVKSTSGGGKRLTADWSVNIGESAVDISVVRQESNKPAIMVLGDRCLFCMEMSGKMRFMKKFDYVVACYKVMEKNSTLGIGTIIATQSHQLLIFSNAKLQWAAQIFSIPICIEISEIKNTEGTLIFLQDNFEITCSYLGTTPSLFTLPRSQHRSIDIDEMEKEIDHYRNQIQQLQSTQDDPVVTTTTTNEMKSPLTIQLSTTLPSTKSNTIEEEEGDARPSVTCQIKLTTSRKLNEVQVSLQCPPGLQATFKQMVLPTLSPSVPAIIRPQIQLNGLCLPSCLNIELSICYTENDDSPRVWMDMLELPLSILAQASTTPKKLEHKVTLDTNLPCVDLTILFNEFKCEDNNANLIGIQYIHGPKACVLTSKSNHRYRIQCEEFAGLWLIVDDFVKRLKKYSPKVEISCNDKPSPDQLYDLMDRHLEVRKARDEVCILLEQRSRQHRSIQRRLLARFKDKTPSPLNCLDSLLEGTHEQLLTLIEAYTDYQQLLNRISSNLTGACLLLSLITQYYCKWDDNGFLTSVLWTGLNDNAAVGWEECVMFAITHLLRTKQKNNQQMLSTSQAQLPRDTMKLKKNLTIFFDRLCKHEKFWNDENKEKCDE